MLMQIQTLKLLVSINVVGFGLIVILTQFAAKGAADRVAIVGWICLIFSVCVFVAPLCIVVNNPLILKLFNFFDKCS